MVLDRASDDLRRRGRAAVDQHDDRPGEVEAVAGGAVVLERVGRSPLGGEDLLAGLQQHRRGRHRGVHDAAGVVAQVEQEPRGALALEPLQSPDDLVASGADEIGDPDVGGVLVDHERVADGVGRHAGALDREVERRGEAGAGDRDVYGGALGPAEPPSRLVDIHPLGRGAVDGLDDVAGAQADPRRRCALDRRDHGDAAAAHRDDDPDPVERALLVLAHVGVGVGAQEVGVGVEEGQHPVEARVNEVGRVGLLRRVVHDDAQQRRVGSHELVGAAELGPCGLARDAARERPRPDHNRR